MPPPEGACHRLFHGRKKMAGISEKEVGGVLSVASLALVQELCE
jgi:hypothetical protein